MSRHAFLIAFALLAAAAPARPADVIVPGDNLIVEGVPPIPASLAQEIGRWTEIREAAFASWHPQRREMLVRTRFGTTNQVHHVRLPGGARTQLTFFAEPVAWASYAPGDGDRVVLGKDIGGNEYFQLFRLDLATGAATLLTDGTSRNTGTLWSRAGDRLAYQSTRRNGQDNDIWVMDPTDPGTDRLVLPVEGGGWGALDWSPDDRQLLVAEYLSVNETYLWLADVATGQKTLVTPKGGPARVAYGAGRFTADGRGLWVTTDRDSEFRRLARIDLATGEHTYLTTGIPWDVDSFEPSWDGRTIAFITNEDGASVLHLLDARSGREQRAPQLPPCVITGLEWHRNDRDLALTLESARYPSDAWSVDVRSGRVERWTTSETGGIDPSHFAEPEIVRWRSFDERAISGVLFRPPARFTGRRPVIVSIHGGPEGQAQPDFQTRLNYFINELGCAVIHPNVRGSTGYGKTFATLDNGLLREGSYRDIAALLDWIATRPDLDPDRVMVMGGSYGGHMVLAVATTWPERIRCAVDYVGISHLATFLENTADYRRDLRRAEYGDERDPELRAFMDRTAPLNNAHKIARPLFIVQGGNDPRVPRTEAEQMLATLRGRGVPVWYLEAKDEGHGFRKKNNSDFLTYALVMFTREFLLAP